MQDCCNAGVSVPGDAETHKCPKCHNQGKTVDLITLKSLLRPTSLEQLHVERAYQFCATESCEVVYFADDCVFNQDEIKVPVFQKRRQELDVPVCYCFGWTPRRIAQELEDNGTSTAGQAIAAHVKAGRCGCEVNNPQGSCCLGNVNKVVKAAQSGEATTSVT